jgi:hypothetical protein
MDRYPLTGSERTNALHVLQNIRKRSTGMYEDMNGPCARAGLAACLDAMLIELDALRDRLRR